MSFKRPAEWMYPSLRRATFSMLAKRATLSLAKSRLVSEHRKLVIIRVSYNVRRKASRGLDLKFTTI